ncbi:MAG: aldo/keto reductase [Lachnospiraceae bacterium]|nr:aldo/keto reductase [Lachnospiraceae bacterium]
MKTRTLGKDLTVSAVGLGCMGFTHAYGVPSDYDAAKRTIEESLDFGYTFYDTAECYTGENPDGSISYNEILVGDALKNHRHEVKIATKFGVHHSPNGLLTDSRPETIRTSIEESLKKLQTDYVDLYYQHRIDPKIPAEEVAGVMGELIQEGKILHWGISETTEEYLRKAHAVCPVTCIQNRYSMMARWDSLFPVLEELKVGYVAFSPLANGTLTSGYKPGETFEKGDYRSFMPQYTEEGYRENEKLISYLQSLAEGKGATIAQISLAWMMAKKPYIVPIPGSRKLERLKENAKAADISLTNEEVTQIDNQLNQIKTSGVFGGSAVRK